MFTNSSDMLRLSLYKEECGSFISALHTVYCQDSVYSIQEKIILPVRVYFNKIFREEKVIYS